MTNNKFPKDKIILEDIKDIYASLDSKIKELEGKKILITGANGMIPSYFVYLFAYLNEYVFKEQASIVLIVRSKNNFRVAPFLKKKYITVLQQDVKDPLKISEKFDYIIHAASIPSPLEYVGHPTETIYANFLGLYNLLNLNLSNLKSFIYFSSAEVYGNPEKNNIPTSEDYLGKTDFMDVRACYSESKKLGEVLCMSQFRQFGTPIKIIRPFHVFSPEISPIDKRIFSSFVLEALEKQEIIINGDGVDTRALCYITDAIIIIIKLLLSKYNGEVFNVGNQKNEVSVKELAFMIKKLLGKKVKIKILKTNGKFDSKVRRACPDMNKVRELLGVVPQTGLENALSRVINFQKRINI
jgi:dTDP-glucose 4,6-dehydratase/UDP-glucuronate decarboxylase